jgi:ribonuclease T1
VKLGRALASGLTLLAMLLLALARLLTHESPPPTKPPSAPADQPRASVPATPASVPGAETAVLASTDDPRRDAQIRRVVESIRRSGRPPEGVAQGGRPGGQRGLFENAEGKLPRRNRGYYVESDIWPRGPGGRGAERLVLGREGEVYFTGDHYRTFQRLQ